jgi:hypothetical protein
MRKNHFLLFLLVFIFIESCKKSSTTNGRESLDFIEATIDGKNYREEFPPANFSFQDDDGCDNQPNKPLIIQNVGQIDVADYFLDPFLRFYSKNVDFKDSQPKSSTIFEPSPFSFDNLPEGCNLDLEIGLDDESFNQVSDKQTTLLADQSSGNIISITKIDESSTEVNYRVRGNFSCKFRNKNGKIISVTGSFQTTIDPKK